MGYMLGSQIELDQKDIDIIVMKYHIPNHYMCRVPNSVEYMSNSKDKEIVISVAHLEVGLSFPLNSFFIWFIKNFWIQSGL